jgi:hypothetical protein
MQKNGFASTIKDLKTNSVNNHTNRINREVEFVKKYSQGIYKNLHNEFVNALKQKLQKLSI